MGNIDYIVGSAVAIEAAISELRSADKTHDIGLVSVYLSHGVYRGLLRNKVLLLRQTKWCSKAACLSCKRRTIYAINRMKTGIANHQTTDAKDASR